MRKLFIITYSLAVILGIAILILSGTSQNLQIVNKNSTYPAERVTNVVSQYTDTGTNYSFKAPSNIKNGISLGVYTVHREVEIYKNGELQYSDKVNPDAFGKSTGYNWAYIPLTENDENCTLEVFTNNCYGTTVTNDTQFYFGSTQRIYSYVVVRYISDLCIGFLFVVIGIIFIIFYFSSKHNKLKKRKSSNYAVITLGIFSVFLGLWSGNQPTLSSLLFQNRILILSMSLVPFVLMIPAFVFFTKEIFSNVANKILNIVVFLNVFVVLSIFILQLLQIVDLRESILVFHFVIAISSVTIIVMAIKEFTNHRATTALKYLAIPIAICALAAGADVISYYFAVSDSNFFGRLGFLILEIFVLKYAISKNAELQTRAKQTDLFKRLSESDSMTGFYNRAALSFALNDANYKSSKNYGFVMLDLNDLKCCNDLLGHNIGDDYIHEASKIISDVFEDYGTCYRYGGDEFVVMINSPDWQTVLNKLSHLDEMQNTFNNGNNPYNMGISWGYAQFNKTLDITLDDTLIRADKKMYEKKLDMKSHCPEHNNED